MSSVNKTEKEEVRLTSFKYSTSLLRYHFKHYTVRISSQGINVFWKSNAKVTIILDDFFSLLVVYTKSVKESEVVSHIIITAFEELSFRKIVKIQIFGFAYSALPLSYSLFRFKIITESSCIYEKC